MLMLVSLALVTTCTLTTPVPQRTPDCYVSRARAGERPGSTWKDASGLIRELMIVEQELVAASRNFTYAARACREHIGEDMGPYFVTPNRLTQLARDGLVLHDGGREVGLSRGIAHPSLLSHIGEAAGKGRLQERHRRCALDGPPWCGRTGVYRPAFEEFRQRLNRHMAAVRAVDGRGNHLGFDGIRAYCAARLRGQP